MIAPPPIARVGRSGSANSTIADAAVITGQRVRREAEHRRRSRARNSKYNLSIAPTRSINRLAP
jgi:hypothetical protein